MSVALLRGLDSAFSGSPAAIAALFGFGGALRVTFATSTSGESRFYTRMKVSQRLNCSQSK